MKKLLAGLMMLALCGGPVRAEESLESLLKDFQVKQNEAIKAYLAAHPTAPDAAAARQRLVMGYRMAGQDELALPLIKEDYAAMAAKGKDADPREVMGLSSMLVQAYLKQGQRDEARAFLDQVRKDFDGGADAERFKRSLESLENSLNKPVKGEVMDLKFKALDGTEVDLAAMKDKVVLVDFWATWCGPCRAELPSVKAAYDKFHAKGFEIVGISLDDDREKLDAFIKKEALPWPQHFDGQGWQNELGQKFGITGIPATFLIGKDGKIAATDLRGAALGATVEQLLNP